LKKLHVLSIREVIFNFLLLGKVDGFVFKINVKITLKHVDFKNIKNNYKKLVEETNRIGYTSTHIRTCTDAK